jgi:hypothetical protein
LHSKGGKAGGKTAKNLAVSRVRRDQVIVEPKIQQIGLEF